MPRGIWASTGRPCAILGERAAVTPEMAVRLGRLCGNGPGLWLRMQQARDLWRVERDFSKEECSFLKKRTKKLLFFRDLANW
jgi:plasmid maintenance system antidote protein VapI